MNTKEVRALIDKIEARAIEDVVDRAYTDSPEDVAYLRGRIRGLRLAKAMLEDAIAGEQL